MGTRCKGLVTAVLCVSSLGAIDAVADQSISLVAVRDIQVRVDARDIIFASIGDVLTLERDAGEELVVQNYAGQRARIPRNLVVLLTEAASVYDRLIREKPDDVRLYSLRADVWAARGESEKVLADYQRALRMAKEKTQVYLSRGVYQASIGNYEQAIADYNQAERLKGPPKSIFINRAAAFEALQKYDLAIRDYSRLIVVEPNAVVGYLRRGIAHRRQGDWPKAIADFSKVIELDPDNLTAVGHRGFAYYSTGLHRKAIEDFSTAIQLSPKDGVAHNNRGYNRQMIGDFKGALSDYAKAIQLAPKYGLAYQNKAWMLATCPDEEFRDGKQALETAKTLCEMREYKIHSDVKALAAAYAEVGDFKRAVQHQQHVVKMTEGEKRPAEQKILKLYRANKPYRFTIDRSPWDCRPLGREDVILFTVKSREQVRDSPHRERVFPGCGVLRLVTFRGSFRKYDEDLHGCFLPTRPQIREYDHGISRQMCCLVLRQLFSPAAALEQIHANRCRSTRYRQAGKKHLRGNNDKDHALAAPPAPRPASPGTHDTFAARHLADHSKPPPLPIGRTRRRTTQWVPATSSLVQRNRLPHA